MKTEPLHPSRLVVEKCPYAEQQFVCGRCVIGTWYVKTTIYGDHEAEPHYRTKREAKEAIRAAQALNPQRRHEYATYEDGEVPSSKAWQELW